KWRHRTEASQKEQAAAAKLADTTEPEVYTVTCLTCGNQRTDDESNTLVTLPSNGAQNAARNHCQKCGTKASVYNKKKFASKPVGWKPKRTLPAKLTKKEREAYAALKKRLDAL